MRGPYFAGAPAETPPAPVFTMARATSPDALSVPDGGLEVLLPAALQDSAESRTSNPASGLSVPQQKCRRWITP